MPQATLRLRGPSGTSSIQLSDDSTFAELQSAIEKASSIAPSHQGRIRNGDPVIVSELSDAVSTPAAPVIAPPSPAAVSAPASTPAARAPPAPVASTPSAIASQKGSGEVEYVELNGGFLVQRVIPDDNSCMFHAVGLVLEQGRQNVVSYLRQVVAQAIRNDPETYSDAVLGQPQQAYINTITSANSWGGAIELSILSQHFKVEICSVDVQTGRIDRFGEGLGFDTRVILVYSGIHYDSVTFSWSPPSPDTAFPPANIEFDTTVFPSDDDAFLVAALELVAKLRAKHAYTDAATFTLKCEDCSTALVGEKEARAHARETGHTSFGEYDG
ncbi:ubiquitin thioesterase OTU1 [Pseudohyphozyma bogoriensis]|nr:ubiquitin thioesterase OTU1 [Pseudohyphozyma bogoriensis]